MFRAKFAILLVIVGCYCFDYEYRLPEDFVPLTYDVTLTLKSFSNKIFGMVQIQLQCKNSTNSITLHAFPNFVTVEHALLENKLLDEASQLDFPFTNTTRQTITFEFPEELIENHVYYLSIWYSTRFATQKNGIIKNRDFKSKGLWIHTLLEPRYARMVFPCFDEPKYRASFRLELWLEGKWADPSYTALSSMPSRATQWNSNLTIWEFDPTPPIPPYIFNFAVGKFQSFCQQSNHIGREVCIFRLDGREEWNKTAEIVIDKIGVYQKGMTEYLNTSSMAQINVLAGPTKLRGMENYGLLLMNENLWPKTEKSLEIFMNTMYHELAHQWFGNLVTVDFWDDIWLSEGLTTFMSKARPIVFNSAWDFQTFPVVHGKWALDIPAIAYSKASALLEMLNSVIGDSQMRTLLQTYVKKHQYKHASTEDFLSILLEVTQDPSPLMFLKSWLYTGSQPIVIIEYNSTNQSFTVSQTGQVVELSANRWFIPIWIECLAGSMPEKLHWILPTENLILPLQSLTSTNGTDSVAFNRNRSVYYQVSYRY
ncbi:unnamed protein product [Bursaphelenchus xylophilus]|uniref:(pine wood nematode) hypothetical protein n=1 Tax=Bursaphelenchus xylophilus TaxID=6326 RepID=A0A7I8X9U3_BURXY|nr:unnamed protein product [Bursaphelenchus xylophilus]CAG9132245.1 unnamed protein product [Bursaphelenchus xylophilus]